MASGRLHDRAILDALDSITPVRFENKVWRVTRAGYIATRGSAANGRWSPGGHVEVLYTSLEREGALAEIGYPLSLEPVWPSRIQHEIHQMTALSEHTLAFAGIASLAPLGVDVSRYESFDYAATQALAAAAHFLEFDGLLVPSACHNATNLVLFMDRGAAVSLAVISSEPVDRAAWRGHRRRPKS
jgi:RES domain-containing protein